MTKNKKNSLRDSDIPVDFQTGGKNNEKINDDDCLFFLLLYHTKELYSPEDGKIRFGNASISSIIHNKFSKSFIRKSLGKLNREGLLEFQLKLVPKQGVGWREITVNKDGLQNNYIQEWIINNSEKLDKSSSNENVPFGIRVDINNTEPLTNDDYLNFCFLLFVEDNIEDKLIRYSNLHLSEISKFDICKKSIYKSLGKLKREGLIQVNFYKVCQVETNWREIIIVDGFSNHQGFRKFIDENRKKAA